MDQANIPEKTALTKDELTILINVVAEFSVPVKNSEKFINLINKMSTMIDDLK